MTADPRSPLARLLRQPARFGFDAAIRVLTRDAGQADPAEVARFRSAPGRGYVPADVLAVRPEAGGPPRVTVGAMALTGAAGVLPELYTQAIATTRRDRSAALHDFLDMLAHRMIAAFARAGTKYRPHRAVEAGALAELPVPDPLARVLLSLTGNGTPHTAERLLAGTDPLLHYAGLFAGRPRSAERLAALASDWIGRPVRVEQFAGAWLALPPEERTRLPAPGFAGAFGRLGVDAAIGVRAWDVQARVVLVIGPLDRAGFEALLPGRPALGRFVSLVRAFLGLETGFAVRPVLAAGAVPALRLDAGADPAPLLGWNTWLPTAARRTRDADDAVFEAEVVEAATMTEGMAA